jgi:ATP-dependent Clp protease ATP-binding subunit ClpA
MFERFADSARQVVTLAQDEAATLHAGHIGTEHLLVALADEPSGPAGRALRGLGLDAPRLREGARRPSELDPEALALLGIDLDEVRRRVEAAFGPGALDRRRPAGGRIPFTPTCKKTLELALRQALSRGDKFIGTQHLLLGLLQAEDEPSVALLRGQGRSLDEVRAALLAEIEPGSAGATG